MSDDKICQGKEAWLWSHKDVSMNLDPAISSLYDINMSLNISEPQFAQL